MTMKKALDIVGRVLYESGKWIVTTGLPAAGECVGKCAGRAINGYKSIRAEYKEAEKNGSRSK